MAFVEGIGDDVTIVIIVLTLGLGLFTVMYLRLVQSVHRNSTVYNNTASSTEYDTVHRSEFTEDRVEYNQTHETSSNQISETIDTQQGHLSSDSQSVQSSETNSTNTERNDGREMNNSEPETQEHESNLDQNELLENITEERESGIRIHRAFDERNFAPPSQEYTNLPTENTEDTTRNRFQSSRLEPNDQGAASTADVICVRIKYNEINRDVQVSKRTTLLEFKRFCFPREMQEGKLVRLIYSGHLLQSDHRSLHDCGIGHLSVVHCQISDTRHVPQQQETDTDLDIGPILVPLLGLLLAGSWYAYFTHPNLFTSTSLIILVFLTMLYSVFLFSTVGTRGSH